MKILEIMTEHTGPFKNLIEVLKEILQETNIEFISDNPDDKDKDNKTKNESDAINLSESDDEYNNNDSDDDDLGSVNSEDEFDNGDTNNDNPKNSDKQNNPVTSTDKSGMRIMAVDTTKTVLINLKLEAKNFTKFKCKSKKLVLGVNLMYLYKLIKSMNNTDNLTLSVDHDDKNHLQIKIDNPDERKDTKYVLKLLDLGNPPLYVPEINFDAVIIMNSNEFNKICREMNQIAEYVEISCLSNKITFVCKGDYAERITTYKAGDGFDGDGITIRYIDNNNKNNPLIIQGIFELKNLILFSKCHQLCEDIEIYMKNDYPLVIKYTVATLGRILLCLTPTNNKVANASFSDEDELYSDGEI